jgi:hypothetical protein
LSSFVSTKKEKGFLGVYSLPVSTNLKSEAKSIFIFIFSFSFFHFPFYGGPKKRDSRRAKKEVKKVN